MKAANQKAHPSPATTRLMVTPLPSDRSFDFRVPDTGQQKAELQSCVRNGGRIRQFGQLDPSGRGGNSQKTTAGRVGGESSPVIFRPLITQGLAFMDM
ncbi:hypothetical protein GMSM_23830 [Geomonas sp. Red276]